MRSRVAAVVSNGLVQTGIGSTVQTLDPHADPSFLIVFTRKLRVANHMQGVVIPLVFGICWNILIFGFVPQTNVYTLLSSAYQLSS